MINKGNKKIYIIRLILLFILFTLTSAATATFLTELNITGNATLQKSLRISDVTFTGLTGTAESTLVTHDNSSISLGFNLPGEITSNLTYSVTVSNATNSAKVISKINVSDANLYIVTSSDYAIGDTISADSTVNFSITVKNKSDTTVTSTTLDFEFTPQRDYSEDLLYNHYSQRGEQVAINTTDGMSVKSLGDGRFILNGKNINSHSFFSLTDALTCVTVNTSFIGRDIIIPIDTRMCFNVEILSGNITVPAVECLKIVLRYDSNNESKVYTDNNFSWYDFYTGIIPSTFENTRFLQNINVLSLFVANSSRGDVLCDNLTIKVSVLPDDHQGFADLINNEWPGMAPPVENPDDRTATLDGLTVSINENYQVVINGKCTSSGNLFIQISKPKVLITHTSRDLHNAVEAAGLPPIFRSGDNVGMDVIDIGGTITGNGGSTFNVVLRGIYNNRNALDSPKILIHPPPTLSSSDVLTKDASMVALYLDTGYRGRTFTDYTLQLTVGKMKGS